MKCLFILSTIVVLTFTSCKNVKHSEDIENFNAFFDRFSKDSIFQKSRVRFPLPYKSVDIMDDAEEVSIKESEWSYIDFISDQNAHKRNTDAFTGTAEALDASNARYVRRGIDNGIFVEYLFKRDTLWRLEQVIDKSN